MVVEDQELQRLGKAFDRAWDWFLRTGMLTPENMQEARTILARRIFMLARLGETDEWHIARGAMFQLWRTMFTDTPPLGWGTAARSKRHTGRAAITSLSSAVHWDGLLANGNFAAPKTLPMPPALPVNAISEMRNSHPSQS